MLALRHEVEGGREQLLARPLPERGCGIIG